MHKFILILFLPLTIFSQTIKTYDGTYEKGKATYQYYEKTNGERVYHGKFHYQCEDMSDNYPFQTIDGNFTDGEKNGKWIFKYEAKGFKDFISTIKKEMPFKNGKLSGVYTEEKSFVETKDGKLEKKINSRKSINYKEDNPKGFFSFENIYPSPSLYKGSIDSLGFADGAWFVKDVLVGEITSDKPSVKFESNLKYLNGLLISNKTINTETGKVLEDFNVSGIALKDTTFYKLSEAIYSNISCFGIYYNQCKTNNGDYIDLFSKKISFDYKTKINKYQPTQYARKFVKILTDSLKKYNDLYSSLLGSLEINYTGDAWKYDKQKNKDRYNNLQLDTAISIHAYNNQIRESIYKISELKKLYLTCFDENGNNPEINLNKSLEDEESRDNFGMLFKNNSQFLPSTFFVNLNDYFSVLCTQFKVNYSALIPGLSIVLKKEIEQNKIIKTKKWLDERARKYTTDLASIERSYNFALIIKEFGKMYSVKNSFLTEQFNSINRELASHTANIEKETDTFKKVFWMEKRDSLITNTEKYFGVIKPLTILIEQNKESGTERGVIYEYNEHKLDIINKEYFKNIYKYYLTDYFEKLSKTNSPILGLELIQQTTLILEKTKVAVNSKNEVFAKELSKLKSSNEIVDYIRSH